MSDITLDRLLVQQIVDAAAKQGVLASAPAPIPVPVPVPAPVPSPTPVVAGVPTTYAAITDHKIYPKPSPPSVGGAGFKFNDPVFGSRMLRVTDGQTRPGLRNRSFRVPSNSHLAAWSCDSKAFYVVSNDGAALPYTFDAASMTATRVRASGTDENGGPTIPGYREPQWSLVNPDVVFIGGPQRLTINAFNVSTGKTTPVVDLTTLGVPLAADPYIGSLMTGGRAPEVLLTHFGGGGQDAHQHVLVQSLDGTGSRKLLNTLGSTINGVKVATTLGFLLHAVQIDQSGRYVFLYPADASRSVVPTIAQVYIWDLGTDRFTKMTNDMHPEGHDAAGYGVWVNQACCTSGSWDAAQWQFRALTSPSLTKDVINPVLLPQRKYMADHASWNNAQRDRIVPFISSTYRYPTSDAEPNPAWRAWDDEILGVNPETGVVYRFAHHRSDVRNDSNPQASNFWYEPIANVSPDGRWVLFTSNWEKMLGMDAAEGGFRQDVFMVGLTGA
jgi:hypothetical protein